MYSESNTLNAKFNELSQIHDVWYAYHGSRVDNFHSILNNGLHAHLNKVSLTNWLTNQLAAWLHDFLTDCQVIWLTDQLSVSVWLVDWLTDWLTDCIMADWLTGEWLLTDRPTNWLTDWCFLPCLIDRLMDWFIALYFI